MYHCDNRAKLVISATNSARRAATDAIHAWFDARLPERARGTIGDICGTATLAQSWTGRAMSRARMPNPIVVLGPIVAVLTVLGAHGAGAASRRCHAATFVAEVTAGAHFGRLLGNGLTFRLEPERLGPDGTDDGWYATVVATASPNDDYIYPVNPPLRFNGVQIFGPSNGDDTKAALAHAHVMYFLLNRADYEHLSPLLTNVLWPYSAPRPDAAGDEYETALQHLVAGQLTCTVVSYETAPDADSLRRLTLRVRATTPAGFAFAPGLAVKPAACPRPPE